MAGVAAEVEYHHPDLTIVAKDEPLDSVLKSVSQEMRIFVTTPTGLNPLVNCDIQNLPLKQAFKKLLGDMSYSLEWKDDGERLVGLTILSSADGSAASTVPDRHSAAPGTNQPASSPAGYRGTPNPGAAITSSHGAAPMPEDDSSVAVEREEQEARMAEERAARDTEMEQRRQEEVIAHEARMAEEAVRNEAEMAEYFESQGINPNP